MFVNKGKEAAISMTLKLDKLVLLKFRGRAIYSDCLDYQKIEFLFTYRLACSTNLANGFSHVYILIICTPEMISFINRIRLSVLRAVLSRNFDVNLPIYTESNYYFLIILEILIYLELGRKQ